MFLSYNNGVDTILITLEKPEKRRLFQERNRENK